MQQGWDEEKLKEIYRERGGRDTDRDVRRDQ